MGKLLSETIRLLGMESGHEMNQDQKTKNEILDEGRTVCLNCGYAGDNIQENYPDLWHGYGCPRCHSCLVVMKTIRKDEGTEKS